MVEIITKDSNRATIEEIITKDTNRATMEEPKGYRGYGRMGYEVTALAGFRVVTPELQGLQGYNFKVITLELQGLLTPSYSGSSMRSYRGYRVIIPITPHQ